MNCFSRVQARGVPLTGTERVENRDGQTSHLVKQKQICFQFLRIGKNVPVNRDGGLNLFRNRDGVKWLIDGQCSSCPS